MRMIALIAGAALLGACSQNDAASSEADKTKLLEAENSFLARNIDQLELGQKAAEARIVVLEGDVETLKRQVRDLQNR